MSPGKRFSIFLTKNLVQNNFYFILKNLTCVPIVSDPPLLRHLPAHRGVLHEETPERPVSLFIPLHNLFFPVFAEI